MRFVLLPPIFLLAIMALIAIAAMLVSAVLFRVADVSADVPACAPIIVYADSDHVVTRAVDSCAPR